MRLNWFKFSYGLIIFLMNLLIIHYTVQVFSGGHDWKTGDWLINYSDGLIRRGLSGTISLFLSQLLSINVKWAVFSIQVLIFVILVTIILQEFYKFKNQPKSIFLLLSPAFAFIFWVNDPSAAFRKEICIYLALVFSLKAFKDIKVNLMWYLASILTFAFAGFSHEMTVFFLPFFIYVIFNHFSNKNSDFKQAIKFSTPFAFLSLLFLIVSIFFKGSEQSVEVICSSLNKYELRQGICDGAITWLQYDLSYAIESVINLGPIVWLNYLFLAALTFLPLLLLRFDKDFWIYISFFAAFFIPLFIVAIDYGRFISMFYTSIILLAIWIHPYAISNMRPLSNIICYLYCCFWSLPHCCKDSPGKGILGNALSSAINSIF